MDLKFGWARGGFLENRDRNKQIRYRQVEIILTEVVSRAPVLDFLDVELSFF